MRTLLFILIMPLMLYSQHPDSMKTERGRLLVGIDIDHVAIFINKYYEAAEQLWLCDSIPMAISLSQWALESGWGRYEPAINNNNIGGIYTRDKKLVKFKSMGSFYRCYVRTVKKPCYKKLNPETNKEWIEALGFDKCCYATSKKYRGKMRWIIKTFRLKDLGKGLNWLLKEKQPERVGYYCKKHDKRYCHECALERRKKRGRIDRWLNGSMRASKKQPWE